MAEKAEAERAEMADLADQAPRRAGAEPLEARSPRLARQRERARRRRTRKLVGAAGLVLAGALATGTALVVTDGELLDAAPLDGTPGEEAAGDEPAADPDGAADDAPQSTLLLVTAEGEDGPATSVTLIAGRGSSEDAAVVFLPLDTLVRVPGFGLERLSAAHRYGGPELLTASIENALGARIDATAVTTDTGFAEFLDRAAPVRMELSERLVATDVDGSREVRFEAGTHDLDGEELAALWRFDSDDELDAFGRRQHVLEGALGATADEVVRDRLLADGVPQLRTEAEPEWVRATLTEVADAHLDEDLRFTLLPVDRFGGGDDGASYRLDEDAADELVEDVLDARDPVAGDALRVQVLNGVGTPGIGREVDAQLEDSRFRITLTGNADRFDVSETRILVYDEQPDTLDAAEDLQAQLGVGTIQVSRQPQSVIDLTVVVGADFAVEEDSGDAGATSTGPARASRPSQPS